EDLGGGPRLVGSAVRRGRGGSPGKLPRRRGWARVGLRSVVRDIIAVEVLVLVGRQDAGELVEDFLSNDCVSLSSRNRMRATATRSERNAESDSRAGYEHDPN